MKKRLGFALAVTLLRSDPAFATAALPEGRFYFAVNRMRDANPSAEARPRCTISHSIGVFPPGKTMGTTPLATLSPPPTTTPEPVSYYRGIYDTEYQNNKAVFDSMAASGDAGTYYTFQYALGGTLSLYEATRDAKYLERALAWAETMVSKAAIMDSNGNRNWSGAWSSRYSPTPIAHQLQDLQGSTELGRLARISLTDPALKRSYGPRVMVIYEFLRDHIVNKHLFKRNGLPWFQNDVVQTRRAMNDKSALLLRVLTSVYLTSAALGGADNATYRWGDILTELAKGFKARLEPYQGGLIWDKGLGWDGPIPPNDPSTLMDTSHANRFPYALVDLYRAGIVFARKDVTGVSRLLTGVIWNRSLTDPRFTNFIDGTNHPALEKPGWGLGSIYHGWVVLAEYDPQVRLVADASLKAILAGTRNPSLDGMNNLHGRIALSGHLSKAAARSSSTSPPPFPTSSLNCSLTWGRDASVAQGPPTLELQHNNSLLTNLRLRLLSCSRCSPQEVVVLSSPPATPPCFLVRQR